ncbi:hypothetical protein BX600DRAFT_552522 [Xylariales sp. PMI_506]|nr:hypothetical protein BX600DRAFT_552522 [Xylariales sp. PMI_506]
MHTYSFWGGLMVAVLQVSASNNRAVITAPPLLRRQGSSKDFIGYTQTGSIFTEVGCGDAVWSTSGSYGNCCDPSYTDCAIATACSSGTLIYPGNNQYDCGSTLPYCDNGLVGATYDPLASTNAPPSISLFWCRTDSATPWSVWRTVSNVVNIGSANQPTLVLSGASGVSAATSTGTSPQATGTSPAAGGTTTGTSATTTAANSGESSSSSSSSGLSVGGLVGVIVSVTCSVLGLLFGVGFKIWQHRREQKKLKRKESEAQEAAPLQAPAEKEASENV